MEQTCESCKYFVQHYRAHIQKPIYSEVYCGHCTCKRVKTRKPDAKACEDWKAPKE